MQDKSVLGQRTLKAGKVLLNGGASVLDCTVRELSPVGARLQFGAVVYLPAVFTLEFSSGEERRRIPCTISWRQMNEIGVTFN
jgi:hypothetical protein